MSRLVGNKNGLVRGGIVVDRQVSTTFTLRKYVDEMMCDVVSMEATHLLLVTYYEVSNRCSFVHLGEKVVLKPLSPRGVCENQIKMRTKREEEREKKE
ncbi:hypothetical protein CR513_34912, partial [Mucuna pruriens]